MTRLVIYQERGILPWLRDHAKILPARGREAHMDIGYVNYWRKSPRLFRLALRALRTGESLDDLFFRRLDGPHFVGKMDREAAPAVQNEEIKGDAISIYKKCGE